MAQTRRKQPVTAMVALRATLFLAAALGALALPDTLVTVKNGCKGNGCMHSTVLDFPKATPASAGSGTGPRFGFGISGKLGEAEVAPTFSSTGSLGLPDHPLGIFKFTTNGSACGTQHLYLEDGILAKITVNFPPCPWGKSVKIGGRVAVWTTLPAVPVLPPFGVPSGFHMQLQVHTGVANKDEALDIVLDLAQRPGSGADPHQDVCAMDMQHLPVYPPKESEEVSIPWATLDLDQDPAERWAHIVQPHADGIKDLLNTFIARLPRGLNSTLVHLILNLGAEELLSRVPAPFDDELRGVARATGIGIGYIFIYNIMYEVEGLCTSMVSEDAAGNIYHSRNLDFGLFDGTDAKAHNWLLTERLRPLMVNLRVMRSGINVYNTTQYAGFIGLLTGAKRGGFSLSVNSRFDAHLDMYLALWFLGKYHGEFLTWKTRQVMESVADYTSALQALSNYLPMGPSYIILGGAKQAEGAVIQLAAGKPKAMLVRTLEEAKRDGDAFVVQTNYDWPAPPPSFDDRRYPTEDCMRKLGPKNTTFATLWAVHSTSPTKNALTTYTTLMSGQTGHFEAYKQFCAPGPNCAPFLQGAPQASSLEVPQELLVV